MNITFYNVSDNPKDLEKNITDVVGTARALAPTGQINVLNPVVVCAWDSTNGNNIINANYAYIDTFKRYYWVLCGLDTAKRIIVSGKVDYLMSWADGIRNCNATITRQENAGINYTIDKQLPVDAQRYVVQGIQFPDTSLEFSNGVTYPQFVMITK